eukprot:1152901-Pelagomonas_calceolata.AAC.19
MDTESGCRVPPQLPPAMRSVRLSVKGQSGRTRAWGSGNTTWVQPKHLGGGSVVWGSDGSCYAVFCACVRWSQEIHARVTGKHTCSKSYSAPPGLHAWLQASPISDWLVFNKIKARLGGRVRVIISGGAPLPVQAEDFLRVSMCAPVIQVWGRQAHECVVAYNMLAHVGISWVA